MSIYQNTYFIVPKKGNYLLLEDLDLKSFLEEDNLFEDNLFWEGLNYEYQKVENNLLKLFKEGSSWSSNLKVFGHIDDNCIEVFLDNNFIISISFRVNFTTDFSDFLEKTVSFCKLNELFIVSNDLKILPLTYNGIQNDILNSKAYDKYKKFGSIID